VKVDLNGQDVSTLSSVTLPQREQPPAAVSDPDTDHQIGEDTATLSSERVNATSLTARVLASNEIRQDKVEALRQAIQKGDYRIEPSQIAAAMIWQSE
jgi:negative regulator of flagellin synthesis FlgM